MRPDSRPAVGVRKRRRFARVFPTTPGAVPVRVFIQVLAELMKPPRRITRAQLEARSGIPARTIHRMLHNVDRSVSFEVADALLTALDANDLWHEPPLAQFLEPAPPRDTLINPITHGQDAARTAALTRHQRTTTEAPT